MQRVLKEILQPLALHGAAPPTLNAPHFQLQVHPCATARQIPHAPLRAVVPRAMHHAAGSSAFFCAPNQLDEPRLAITEDSVHRRQGTKSGKGVQIL